MDKFYDVSFKVHNAASDAWNAKVQYTTKDYREAVANFGSEISRLFGSKDFDFVCVTLSDNFGNELDKKYIDERVKPEPPEPNTKG